MNPLSIFKDTAVVKAMEDVALKKNFKPYLCQIIAALDQGEMDRHTLHEILQNNSIEKSSDSRAEILDLLLLYITIVLQDNVITAQELFQLKVLKRFFGIKEGDFYNFRSDQVREILNKQFKRIYQDKVIDPNEALLKVGLQELFDLGYDQFHELSQQEIKRAIDSGANLNDLDTVMRLPDLK